MTIYRAAVIGAGRIGLKLEADPKRLKPASHAGTWLANQRTELVALCDSDANLQSTAETIAPGVACYNDAQTMLADQRPDIVSIATHQDSHVALAQQAIRHGVKAVVCEKPLSDDIDAGLDLLREADRAGTILIVNHARRFDPMLQSLAQRLSDGLIGDVQQIHGVYVYGLESTGTHLIDTIRMLVGDKAGDINAVQGWTNAQQPFHPPDDPCIDGMVEFGSGAKATLQSLNMKDYDCFDLTIFGRNGKLALRDRGLQAEIYPAIPAASRSGFTDLDLTPVETLRSDQTGYFKLLGDNVVACLDGQARPASTGQDSLTALRILKAIRQSADMGGDKVLIATHESEITASTEPMRHGTRT